MRMHVYILEDCKTPRHPVKPENEAVLDHIEVNNVSFPQVIYCIARKFDRELNLAVGSWG